MSQALQLADAARTLELLHKRVRERGDMPGVGKAIRAIVNAMHGESDREFNMTKTVLSDPVLTQKVLRLANSPMYAVFGQAINTVTKAVIVLGTDAIGHVALGLKLVDSLSQATPDTALAREEMGKAVLAGQIARQLAGSAGTRDAEEAVVSSMLHGLGRMLASFYLPEYWARAVEAVEAGEDEHAVVNELFGMSLAELGRQVAKRWGLPDSLVASLREVGPRPVDEPLDHQDWLAAVSTLAYRSANIVWNEPESPLALSQIATDYADMLGIPGEDLLAAIDVACHEPGEEAQGEAGTVPTQPVSAAVRLARKPVAVVPEPRDPVVSARVLAQGVVEMRDVVSALNPTQLMTMGLETIHQALSLDKSVVFLRNPERSQYRGRIYFGAGVQEVLPQLLVPDAYQPDVFHASLATGKMVFVESAQEAAFLARLPRWWRNAFPGVRSFLVLPLAIQRQPVGFIYGDWGVNMSAPALVGSELTPLNELLALMMSGMEQRRRSAA